MSIEFNWTDEVDEILDMFRPREGRVMLGMDLAAANGVNGNPSLDYARLLGEFDRFSQSHDVLGIEKHINRATGKLEGFFVPRCRASNGHRPIQSLRD